MSYRLEGKDIVVSGFQDGVADSPYEGISDIRNIDLISIPGEASVAFSTTNSIAYASGIGVTFTADSTTDVFTYSGTPLLITNQAITVANSGGALPTGLAINIAYYIINPTATTFQLAVTAGGSAINITDNGTGAQSFTTIDLAKPKFFTKSFSVAIGVLSYSYFCLDSNGRAWYFYNNSQWVYMRNFGAYGASGESLAGTTEVGNGLAFWKGYLFVFRLQLIAIIKVVDPTTGLQTLTNLTTAGNWTGNWQNLTGPWSTTNWPNDISHAAFAGPTDDVLYFCNTSFVGSLIQVAGSVFAPGTPATFTYNNSALVIPQNDAAQCIDQLGTNLLIGGWNNIIYSWDRISAGYDPIFIAESFTSQIVVVNTNAFIFAGQRGRIFYTNGSQAELFKKVPDHLSNQPNPYFTWGGATANRNQLYFGIQATNNAGMAINQYGGLWAIDLDSKAIRLVTQMSHASYAGIVSAVIPLAGVTTSDGFGMIMGWYTTVGGIDKYAATPYTGGQSYIDSDIMPLGTFLDPFTGSQVEWKTALPLVSGESMALYYRVNITDAYTLIGTTSTAGVLADKYPVNFQKAQWVQLRSVLTSTTSSPSYCRLTEFRIRDYPSGKNSR